MIVTGIACSNTGINTSIAGSRKMRKSGTKIQHRIKYRSGQATSV